VEENADILLMADDHMFIAHNMHNGKIATNHVCTGVIYAEIASRYLHAKSKEILVIGLGRVGYAGAEHLVNKGFTVYACDPDSKIMEKAKKELGIIPYDPKKPEKFSMVFEATPNPDTISEGMIAERCLVSTPGIPCGLPEHIGSKDHVDLVMEPLVIGVASMLYSVI
jgi:pyrrolysine biosynthesis protein PylD